jgi:hypothetical protein
MLKLLDSAKQRACAQSSLPMYQRKFLKQNIGILETQIYSFGHFEKFGGFGPVWEV